MLLGTRERGEVSYKELGMTGQQHGRCTLHKAESNNSQIREEVGPCIERGYKKKKCRKAPTLHGCEGTWQVGGEIQNGEAHNTRV